MMEFDIELIRLMELGAPADSTSTMLGRRYNYIYPHHWELTVERHYIIIMSKDYSNVVARMRENPKRRSYVAIPYEDLSTGGGDMKIDLNIRIMFHEDVVEKSHRGVYCGSHTFKMPYKHFLKGPLLKDIKIPNEGNYFSILWWPTASYGSTTFDGPVVQHHTNILLKNFRNIKLVGFSGEEGDISLQFNWDTSADPNANYETYMF